MILEKNEEPFWFDSARQWVTLDKCLHPCSDTFDDCYSLKSCIRKLKKWNVPKGTKFSITNMYLKTRDTIMTKK
jgi:hypothetical protein